jgi:hypothetical protein
MRAVGRLHTNGVARRMTIAAPKPTFCTSSSIPYGPPDTMKYRAPTSATSVIRRAGKGGSRVTRP